MAENQLRVDGRPVPSPAEMAQNAAMVATIAERLGVDGMGGDPPTGQAGLPAPGELADQRRAARVGYVFSAAKLFDADMAPIEGLIFALRASYEDYEAAWKLYRYSYDAMRGAQDFLLTAAPAHRLVRRRVLPAVMVALEDPDLPDDERADVAMDLEQLKALVQQELEQALLSRDKSATLAEDTERELTELRAEEDMVDVMLRMTTREPVSREEMARAGATYVRLMAQDVGDDDEDDRRAGLR